MSGKKESAMNGKDKYDIMDFIDDVIETCFCVAAMGITAMIFVSLWGLYNPHIKATLLAIQTEFFRYFI
jgi:hypothetical protein